MHGVPLAPDESPPLWDSPLPSPEYGAAPPLQAPPAPSQQHGSQAGHMAMAAAAPVHDVYRPGVAPPPKAQAPLPPPLIPPPPPAYQPPPPVVAMAGYATQGPQPQHQAVHGEAPPSRAGLGLRLLLLGGAVAAGGYVGSWPGALSSALLAGAAINGFEAVQGYRKGTDESDRRAHKSLLFGAVGLAGGGVIWYRYVAKRPLTPNPEPSSPASQRGGIQHLDPCNIRSAGP